MAITLSDRERTLIAAFEDETGAAVTDCVVFEDDDRVVFVVAPGDMATAIGPGGETVRAAEGRLGWSIDLVEDADDAGTFVANALTPAAVYNVTVSENDDVVAYAEVATEDRGAAIGKEGRNIETARRLAARHFGVDDVQLT